MTPPTNSSTCPRCGGALALGGMCAACVFESAMGDHVPPAVVEMPGRVGDFDLISEIARGGMGVVWRARHRRLGREVALKFVRDQWLPGEEGAVRFHAEAQAAAQLRHPHIVTVHEVGEADGRYFLSMELLTGGTLAQRMKMSPLAQREAAALLAKVARAVHHAHERGILHRDLKPANILLDGAGEPRVADFGLARLSERDCSLTLSGVLMGTPAYISPEQAAGIQRAITHASDTYSLGAILFEMLAGRPPFFAESQFEMLRQVMDDDPPRPSALAPGADRDLETIALKCLDKNPAARYASALALAEDLERWLGDVPIAARRTGAIERTRKWARRHPALAALSLALALALAAAAFVLSRLRDAERRAAATRAPDPDANVFGDAAVDRWENDSNAGTLVVRAKPAGVSGRLVEWTFYDNEAPGKKVTPLLFEALPGNQFVIRGIGASCASDASGVQTFPFALLAGTDAVGPATCFGFADVDAAIVGSAPRVAASSTGVIDGSFYGGGAWLFTPGLRYNLRIGETFTGPNPDGLTNEPRLDAGRVYSAQFRVGK